ncbi:hypothetical protein Pfo_025388 [Paulownia fortunei]|nr:hypothetical protein Pfo_025388 [Paulownia fortunei]
MARRSPRIPELRENNELSCMWGLFSIIESCQGGTSRKLICNGRPANKHIIDYPREIDQLASFDEECRRIRNEADLASVAVDASVRNVGNFIREDMPFEKHKTKQNIVKGQQHAKMDSELVDCLVKTHKRARKNSQKAYQSSSCHLNNAAGLIHQLPSTSAEISLNKLTLAAILGAVCAQNQQEESMLSESFKRSIHLGKYDQVDEINMQQVQMSAKAFVDQMFIDRKFICKDGTNSESKSFSDALEVLNSNKDLFMELLPDPNCLLARRIKNLLHSQTEKETFKSVLDAEFSECEGLDATSSEIPGSTLATQKGKMNKNLWQKINCQYQYSPKTSFIAQPSDKIVILKPAPPNAKHSENVTCHCSSLQSHKKLSRRVSDTKPTSFSFREMKKKLKHTFGVTRKEPSQFSMVGTSDKLSHNRSTLKVGDDCICRGVGIRNSFNSSPIAETKGNLCKKQDLNSSRGSDIARVTDTGCKKVDFSSVRICDKQEFDVLLEAKRHLSTRWKNLNAAETVASKKSPKTLGRILSSPEHDFWPLSPRRDSQHFSGSAQMRFSPYNTSPRVTESSSHIPNGRERACLSPLRPNTQVTSCDDYDKYDSTLQIMDTKTSSLIPSTDEEVHDTDISVTDDMKSNGESKFVEMNSILRPQLHISEVPSKINSTDVTRTMQINDTIELQKDDETVMHSILDSLSENEAFTSTADYFPSTPLSIHQLDTADSIKYQEHQSPVSVLEPFFIEDANSPPSSTLQTGPFAAGKQLQPLRLDFEECSSESFPQDLPISANSCIKEQDHLSQYVHLVLQASCLNWDQLSEIRSLPEELLHASLFDEVEFLPTDCYFDPKLLFDHINEVLLEIYQCHFCSPPWLAFRKPKIRPAPLAELVLDEIMTEADFYLLPWTEKRTLDQLVSKDVADCRSWLDVRLDTEQIVNEISEDVLEESILDILLEFIT